MLGWSQMKKTMSQAQRTSQSAVQNLTGQARLSAGGDNMKNNIYREEGELLVEGSIFSQPGPLLSYLKSQDHVHPELCSFCLCLQAMWQLSLLLQDKARYFVGPSAIPGVKSPAEVLFVGSFCQN